MTASRGHQLTLYYAAHETQPRQTGVKQQWTPKMHATAGRPDRRPKPPLFPRYPLTCRVSVAEYAALYTRSVSVRVRRVR